MSRRGETSDSRCLSPLEPCLSKGDPDPRREKQLHFRVKERILSSLSTLSLVFSLVLVQVRELTKEKEERKVYTRQLISYTLPLPPRTFITHLFLHVFSSRFKREKKKQSTIGTRTFLAGTSSKTQKENFVKETSFSKTCEENRCALEMMICRYDW